MTSPWQRVGLGLHRFATAGFQLSLNRSTALLDRLVYHAVDSFDRNYRRQQQHWDHRSSMDYMNIQSERGFEKGSGGENKIFSISEDIAPARNTVSSDTSNSTIEEESSTEPLPDIAKEAKGQKKDVPITNPDPTLSSDHQETTQVIEKEDKQHVVADESHYETTTTTTPNPTPSRALPSSPNPPETLIQEGHAVPSTRIQRAAGFANLGLGLAMGTLRQRLNWEGTTSNEERLANTLCRMRGAALKLGQMLSIQDEHTMLPKSLARALDKVRQGADAMPQQQLERQLTNELGDEWRTAHFDSFTMRPFAAASIGQVHHATLPDGRAVVVKVQYPGVADSIHSDLRNLSMLVQYSGIAPKGLFLDNVIRVGEAELKIECDYLQETKNQLRMKQLVENDSFLRDNQVFVPNVIESLCTSNVFVSEFAPGSTIDAIATTASQEERNRIGRLILYICIKELFEWRFMQTDPNWGNFLYDVATKTTTLIDFGAAREYDKEFVDGYLRIVWASAIQDAETLMAQSRRMGFLTGEENEQMVRAHKLSGFTVGEPFSKDEAFDFRASRISERMSEHTAVFLRHRLSPPPAEVYTLHRKLAGAYMLCIKLGAVVKSRDILEEVVANHSFDDGLPNPL